MEYKQFTEQLADAYEHIYDLVYLRAHPLIDRLFPEVAASRKDNAWQLHHTLLDAINELDPGPQAPAFSREWRRHRLMVLRYVDGLTPQMVADQLAISRRHFYREQESAIEALARVLLKRYPPGEAEPVGISPDAITTEPQEPQQAIVDRMELLRLEAAQMTQIKRRAVLGEVVRGVLTILSTTAREHHLAIDNYLPQDLADVWGDHRLIRQLLMALIGHLINISEDGSLIISAQARDQRLYLDLAVSPVSAIFGSVESDSQTPFSVFEELAALSGVALLPYSESEAPAAVVGFTVVMQIYDVHRTILVVDDNQDILELFHRYLKAHYEVVQVRTAQEALEQADRLLPFAIILDLMIPDQDGWDLMQILLNQPKTRSIPIIICSVLRQKELALSLGATAFLEKPVSEEILLSVLNKISPDTVKP